MGGLPEVLDLQGEPDLDGRLLLLLLRRLLGADHDQCPVFLVSGEGAQNGLDRRLMQFFVEKVFVYVDQGEAA